MDVQREIQSLIESGLKFSIEVNGRSVLVWVGDYVRQSGAAATVASLEQAVEWLHLNGHVSAPAQA